MTTDTKTPQWEVRFKASKAPLASYPTIEQARADRNATAKRMARITRQPVSVVLRRITITKV